MYAFAVGLALTYLALGVLVAVTVRLSHAVFEHLPAWGILLIYLGVGALCVFMLTIANVLAIMAVLTIALGLTVLVGMRLLTIAVPRVADALLQPFRRIMK